MKTGQIIRQIGSAFNVLALVVMVLFLLWFVGEFDLVTAAAQGAFYAATLRELVNLIPWGIIIVTLLFAVLIFALWACWDRVQQWIELRKSVSVKVVK